MSWREIALCLFVLILSLFAGDQVMGLLGYPAERQIQVAHPENFHEQRKTLEFAYDFRTNSQGLRYADIPLEKPEGETRVLLLGDSFTEGIGVEASETFSAHLERLFSERGPGPVRFINGGLAGQGPVQYWRLFYRIGLSYQPDAIVICYFANDLDNMPDDFRREGLYSFEWGGYEAKEPGLKKAFQFLFPRVYLALVQIKDRFSDHKGRDGSGADPNGDFIEAVTTRARDRGYPEDEIERWLRSIDPDVLRAAMSDFSLSQVLSVSLLRRDLYKNALDLTGANGERKLSDIFFIFEEMHRVAQEKSAPLWLVFLPSKWQYDPRAHEPGNPRFKHGMIRAAWLTEETAMQGRLKAWAETKGIPFLDMTGPLRARVRERWPLNYRLDEHWNPAGHEVAAEIIRDWIVEQGLLESLSR